MDSHGVPHDFRSAGSAGVKSPSGSVSQFGHSLSPQDRLSDKDGTDLSAMSKGTKKVP